MTLREKQDVMENLGGGTNTAGTSRIFGGLAEILIDLRDDLAETGTTFNQTLLLIASELSQIRKILEDAKVEIT